MPCFCFHVSVAFQSIQHVCVLANHVSACPLLVESYCCNASDLELGNRDSRSQAICSPVMYVCSKKKIRGPLHKTPCIHPPYLVGGFEPKTALLVCDYYNLPLFQACSWGPQAYEEALTFIAASSGEARILDLVSAHEHGR